MKILSAVFMTILFWASAIASEHPAPYINPLGDMGAYSSVEIVKNASLEIEIQVEDAIRMEEVSGDIWYMNQDGDPEAYRQPLKAYAESIGAEILQWDPSMAIFKKDAGKGEVWWCRARLEQGLELVVVKTLRIDPGKRISFEMGEEKRAEVRFHTINPGGKFRSLTLTIPNDGEYTVEAEQIIQTGAYKRTVNRKWYANGGRAKRFVFDTIPQEAGSCTFTLSTNSDTPAANVIVELTEHQYPVPVVEMGEKLGALRVMNVPYGLAKVRTDSQFGVIYTDHPEIPGGTSFENGDVTPEGDAYFLLPAGLWTVEIGPNKTDKATAIRANLIPVHSGKETVLDWPLAMTGVFGEEGGNGLEINDIERKGNQIDVTFSLHGEDAKSIIPKERDLTIKEGGVKAEVLSVKRTRIPLDIVLLLDSSGSMKGQMKNALDATRRFIKTLPIDAKIRVVDFDTKPKPIDGTTKDKALKGLAKVRANGATALNDSVLLGLEMLNGAKRPALLLFTDGFDANHNDSGPGSKATKEETLAAVNKGKIPVYTIGFGKGHDINTLDRIASLSGGRYYAASNPTALTDAFAFIRSNLSNTFTATYARPAKSRPSDVPVVTCMVDVSGSMDTTPDKSGCDYRMDKVKTLLHDFYTSLPDDILCQVMSFEDDIYINQVTTSNKGAILAGINDLYANGGTQIGMAVFSALKTQAAIPSGKRYMIFITDAALEVDGEEKVFFDTMLAKLKDEGIYCLWVGIGALDEKAFKHAAQISGGRYILTESPDALAQSLETLVADIRKPAAKNQDVKTLVDVTLAYREKSGRNRTFANAEQAILPIVNSDTSVELPAAIGYTLTDLKKRYDPKTADMITGDSVPVRDAKISKRIPIGVTGKNEAASFTINEAYFLSRLRGVDAPSSFRYLVLTTEMKNILPRQTVIVYPDGTNHPASWVGNEAATKGKQVQMVPTYLIPDLKRHLFLRWNNEFVTSVSPATWLTEQPLILPGQNAVAIEPEKTVAGALAFMVPEDHMKQLSLHYYDTNYGHAEIPLIGAMTRELDRISTLPPKPPVKLSDAFSLSIREVKDVKKIGKQEAGDYGVYRIVEADFISNVQALLDINPAERFSLRLNTKEGALGVRLHGATGLLPLGFLSPTLLSPGSNNRIRLAFRVPEDTAKEAGLGELVVDVRGGGVVIPLDARAANAPDIQPPAGAITGDAISMVINDFKRSNNDDDMYVADITLFDTKDGESTSMSNAFILKKKGFKEQDGLENEIPIPDYGKTKGMAGFATGNAIIPIGTMPPDSTTDDLVFGITESTVIPDGGSLRGLVIFKLPYGDAEPSDWTLTSDLFPGLNHDLDTRRYPGGKLLIRRDSVSLDANSSHIDELNEAVAKLKRQRDARQFKRPGHYKPKVKNVDGGAPPMRSVPTPEATDPALVQFAAIKDIASLKKRLATVRYLPTGGMDWHHMFAPQAVLTQNWGSEGDLARMAEMVLARQGIKTKRITLEVTDKGRTRLAAMAGLAETNVSSLPALLYHDAKGDKHVLVSPFLEPLTRLPGLVGKMQYDDISSDDMQSTVTVTLLVKPKSGGSGQVNRDLSNALSGETNTGDIESIYLLTANPTLPELSRGAVDIGYTVVGYKSGAVIKAIFDGNDKRVIGSETLDTGEYEVVGERINIDMANSQLVYERRLEEGESILDRFHTLGLNLPDMTMGAARSLDKVMQEIHKAEDAPDNLSALKWYSRNLVYKFVCAQTRYENDLAGKKELVVGRTTKPRCIIATVSRPNQDATVRTTIDLRQTVNQVHPGPDTTEQAIHGFNIVSGIFASKLEADILTDGGMGFFEMVAFFPEDTDLLWLTSDARYNMEDELNAAMPPHVFKMLNANDNTVLFPSQPAIVDGKPRWAWLEVNPNTYETIAVLDTGERGSMIERVFSDLWRDGLDYITGGLVGVSSSVWSVSAYSLIMSDYKKILAAAKKFALGLADNFSASVKIGDVEIKGAVGGSDAEGSYSGTGSDVLNRGRNAKNMWDKINDPKIDLGGFEGGFKDGVNYYFSQAGG
jgi:Mg-chelatase subunit ChlD